VDFLTEVTFYSDEVWYTLSGNINSQYDRYWSAENHEVPLHDLKVGVWCSVSVQTIIEPVFFHKTIPNVEIDSVTFLQSAD
jgi:hypothetical protein